MLPRSTDIVIIGAGVIGASIAYHLGLRGIKAVVLEKDHFACGSSGACEGHVFLQSKKPGLHLRLALESRRRFEELKDLFGTEIEYKGNGGMVVIESRDELDIMRPFVEEQQKNGLAVSLLDRQEALELEPSLSDNIAGAAFSTLDASVNPMALTLAFIRAARRSGARVFSGQEVIDIETVKGRVQAVRTVDHRIETPLVVNAAGAAAAFLGKRVALDIPITPRRGQLLVTAPQPPMIQHCLLSAQYIAAKFDPRLAGTGGMGISVEQTANGNLLLGATREFVGFDRRTTFDGIRSIARRIIRLIPGLKQAPVIRTFSGLRPYTPDGLPILGNVKAMDGFIMASGHEGDGIALSPITGELIAELIDTGTTRYPLDDFRLERFNSTSESP